MVPEGMFRRVGGKPVTREMKCGCGRIFVQTQVSKRFVSMMPPAALHIFKHSCPDGFVPCNCAPCERHALAEHESLYARQR